MLDHQAMLFGALVVATMLLAGHPIRPIAIDIDWQRVEATIPCAEGAPELCPAIDAPAD